MLQSFLPPEDLPPLELTPGDRLLRQELEEAVRRHFYQACDGVTQSLLLTCDWKISIRAEALKLVVNCPDHLTSCRVRNNITPIGTSLAKFSLSASILICPHPDAGSSLEIRVDEISV